MQNLAPHWRLSLATVLMLFFAASEHVAGLLFYLPALKADALNMLSHSLVLFVTLAVTLLGNNFQKHQTAFEIVGTAICIGFMWVMAYQLLFQGMGHMHHAPMMMDDDMCGNTPMSDMPHSHGLEAFTPVHNYGWLLSFFAIISFCLHSFVTYLLYKGKENVAVLGVCMNMSAHVLMSIFMFISGLLMQMYHFHFLNSWITYAIAICMITMSLHLLWRIGKLIFNINNE